MTVTNQECSRSEEINEIWKLFRETDRKFKETDQRFKETDGKFKETDGKFKETDRKFKETDQRFKETDQKFQETKELVNRLSGKWGRFVEGLVAPGAIRLFRERGIDIERTTQRVKARKGGEELEIDILCINDKDMVAIEVKSTLSVDDVNEHIERLKTFKRFFPEYEDKQLFGAVAGIVMDGESDKYAYRQGLFVISQTGETVHILNDKKFAPKAW